MGFKLTDAVEIEMSRAHDASALRALVAQLDAARDRVRKALDETRAVIECHCSKCDRDFRLTMSNAEERERGIPETCVECFETDMLENPRPYMQEDGPVTSVYREPQFAYSRDVNPRS